MIPFLQLRYFFSVVVKCYALPMAKGLAAARTDLARTFIVNLESSFGEEKKKGYFFWAFAYLDCGGKRDFENK